MRKHLSVKVSLIREIKPSIFLLGFSSTYLSKIAKPGQFLHIKIDQNIILRRPFSIHSIKDETVYILFSVRGRGTYRLSKCKVSDKLDIIGPLGNGFDYKILDKKINILVAGGIGVAPLLFLAERLKSINGDFENFAILGIKNKDLLLCKKEFQDLNFKTYISSEDGKIGYKGTAPSLLEKLLKENKITSAQIYSCGPKEMYLKMQEILKNYPQIDCQVLVEQFMGCGLGICCGCAIETKEGYKKVCIDGPVFKLNDIK